MGYIIGLLVIGALLSAVFGRHVGAMFVTGTATVVSIALIAVMILLFPLFWGFLHEPNPVKTSSTTGYFAPVYRSPNAPAGTLAPSVPMRYAAQVSAPTPQVSSAAPSVSAARSADYDRAIELAVDAALSPLGWRCPTAPQARLQMADRYRGVAEYIRQRAPYADPGKPGLYEDYAQECDHVATHLADLSQSLAPNTTPSDLTR